MKFKSAFAILLVMSMTISTLPMMNDMEVEGVDGNFGGGTGSVSDPFIIEDVWDLQEMNKNLSANYTLSNDIDASETATWNDGAGFLPIGERYYHMDGWSEKPFTGSLDGGDHKISGIFIYHEHKDLLRTLPSIGLFGFIGSEGTVNDLKMTGSNIEVNSTSGASIGGLVGYNEGSISNCIFRGRVTGMTAAGGLIGINLGTVSNCHCDVEVEDTGEIGNIGGLIGVNDGIVSDSTSEGIISGSFYTGGLIGLNSGRFINNSYSTCEVRSNSTGGGLIGRTGKARISDCHSTGDVHGISNVGGLIGWSEAKIINCHSIGNVRGLEVIVGGFLGISTGNIEYCYSRGDVYGGQDIGGLIGRNQGNLSNCHSISNVTGVGNLVGGLIGSSLIGSIERSYFIGTVYGSKSVGGLVGSNGGIYSHEDDRIMECFSSGTVNGEKISVGGFAGSNFIPIENCYSSCDVQGQGTSGGFIGSNSGANITNCYSNGEVAGTGNEIGGFVGENAIFFEEEGSFENCYWDIDTSRQNISAGGEGKSTLEMISRSTYVSWDFTNTWGIIDGEDYPYLQALIDARGASIISPRHAGTLMKGDSLRFIGSSSTSPEIGYKWTFDNERTSSQKDPGLIPFTSTGSENISYSFTLNGKEYLEEDTLEFEVVEGTSTTPDLKVVRIDIPDTLKIGEVSTITYDVANLEEGPVEGETWKDSIYLSNDPYLDSMDMLLNSTMVSMNIQGNGGYSGSMNITTPPLVEGAHYLILSVNDEWSFLERHRPNNEKEVSFNVAIPELKEGIEVEKEFTVAKFDHYYMIKLPTSRNIHLSLEGSDDLEIIVSHGEIPSISDNEYHSYNGELTIRSAYSGIWYVLVHGGEKSEPGTYSIQFDEVELVLESVAPSRYLRGVPFELYIAGIGFSEPLQVILVGSDGSEHEVPLVDVNTARMTTAHVKGNLLSVDTYDVRVVIPGKGMAELDNVLTILDEGEPKFEASIDPGQYTGYHEHSTVYVEYSNTGDIAMRAPLLFLTAISGPDDRRGCLLTHDPDRLKYGVWTAGMKAGTLPETPADLVPEGFYNELMILASGEVPGLLQAGETRRIPVYYAGWEIPYPSFGLDLEWQLYIVTEEDENEMDWDSAKDVMMSDDISDDAWDIIWDNFVNSVGTTYGDFIRTLNGNALYLYQHGQRIEDIDEILSLYWQQANGWTPYSSIYSSNDIELERTGLDLTFERIFPNPIFLRFEKGDMGWGWMHNWEYSLIREDDGTVKIRENSGNMRIFQPNIRSRNAYMSQPGDWGELKVNSEGDFVLEEKNGITLVFGSEGKLERMEDRNGNTITCQYTDDHLSKLVHSSGSYIDMTFNGEGLIDQITDEFERTTTFTYDDGYLTSVEYNDGFTEEYEYDRTEGSASEHALTGIIPTGDSKIQITYNTRGAMRSYYRGEDLEKYSFIYGMGHVRITDLLGNTERFFHDTKGMVIRYDNSLGDSYCVAHDGLGQIVSINEPTGLTTELENFNGNLIGLRDRAGNDYDIAYDPTLDLMERISFPTGSSMLYDLDTNGNLVGIVYPDGSRETGSYDDDGNLLSHTGRQGNTTEYTYDTNGRITSKRYADGSEIVYTYDERGNLRSMDDSTGLTNFTHDINDQVTRIEYPGGQWLQFTYDNARRRSAIIDQMGNRINYDYDHAGRLEGLTTSTGIDLVTYEYDQLGRTSRKTVENGVYTTYGYDAAGRITKLANFHEDETVISWFNYTYDVSGRMTKANTHEGIWQYAYDDMDQLVSAVFDPTDPELSTQDIEYNYDMMGNRIRTVTNGIEEYYGSNDLNQCTSAGNVTFGYDPDSNLISETGPNGTTTYTYNDDNRLISASSGSNHWEYSYDGLGNRVSITENGNTSYLVVDPTGIGNVVGVYDANGTMTTRYIYGSGLIGFETGSGESYYYNFDLMGNTREVTDSTGAIVSSYSYMPFGEAISEEGVVSNPFRFGGEMGIMTDSTGLIHMRARHYDPQIGRFTSLDPLGIYGGDHNFYRYAFNSAPNFDDPEGLSAFGFAAQKVIQYSNRVLNTYQVTNNFAPYGSAAESGARYIVSPTTAKFIGSGLDIVTGVGSILSLGTTYAAAAALMGPVGAVVVVGAVVGVAAYGIYKGIKFIASLFDFEPANTLTPLDPNHKECLYGIGLQGHVAEETKLSYRIEFENMKEATAPAQIVTVLDPLSEDLDWSTFEFTEIGFGDLAIPLDPGTKFIDEMLDFSYEDDDYDMDMELHIIGEIDTTKGEVFVMFYSIDPETDLPPEVNVGFLPPEDGTGRGQGYFTYDIDPEPDLPSGTEIRNIATIQFNLGMEIDTNQIDPLDKTKGTSPDLEALVTIDAGSPSSSVNDLMTFVDEIFEVTWTGQDEEGGSGISTYDVYVKENDGPWTLWLEETNLTAAEFTGTLNSTYEFYSIATDLVGHQESKDPLSEASTTVREIAAPVANAGPDQTVEEGTNVTFDGTGSNDEIGIEVFTWTFNDGNEDVVLNGVSPVHLFEVPGNYTITLNVTNAGGLWDTDSMLLTVTEKADDQQPPDDDDDGKDSDKGLSGTFCVLCMVLIVLFIIALVFVFVVIRSRRGDFDEE